MRAYDIIEKKKNGIVLSRDEIYFFINGYVSGEIPDYQASAFLMAVCINGMTEKETAFLTYAIRDSGEKIDFSRIKGIKADKHSTGGVGDKTSLIVAPVVASLGLKVAKMSGRGLGHTGGTIDKLESIEGFNCFIPLEKFEKTVNETGLAIIGQSADLAPADKKLYALRDVTATIDSVPLIASSIMGKKLAVNDDCIVLDVKTGSGAFMKTFEKSEELACAMVNIGKNAGKKIAALITDMSAPLGRAVGNSLEIIEAIKVLNGETLCGFNSRVSAEVSGENTANGQQTFDDLTELCVSLAAKIYDLSENCGEIKAREKVVYAIKSGKAKQKFKEMIKAQGGNENCVCDLSLFTPALHSAEVLSDKSGFITETDALCYGNAAFVLGAGRQKLGDKIDKTAGVYLNKKIGERVEKGEKTATLYSSVTSDFSAAKKLVLNGIKISEKPPEKKKIVLSVIG